MHSVVQVAVIVTGMKTNITDPYSPTLLKNISAMSIEGRLK